MTTVSEIATPRRRFPRQPRRRLSPIDTIHKAEHSQNVASPLVRMPAECPECEKSFCGGAVVVDEPIYNVRTSRHTVLLFLYCNHGSHIAVFKAFCNRDASRIDAPAGDPYIIRSAKLVDAFLTAHPEARGIEM